LNVTDGARRTLADAKGVNLGRRWVDISRQNGLNGQGGSAVGQVERVRCIARLGRVTVERALVVHGQCGSSDVDRVILGHELVRVDRGVERRQHGG
jgi:hypothetical protein